MWTEFLAQEFNHPDRHDYYLAQVAAEVRRGSMNCKHPNKVRLKDMLLKFENKEKKTETLKEADARAKKFWLSFIGHKPKD